MCTIEQKRDKGPYLYTHTHTHIYIVRHLITGCGNFSLLSRKMKPVQKRSQFIGMQTDDKRTACLAIGIVLYTNKIDQLNHAWNGSSCSARPKLPPIMTGNLTAATAGIYDYLIGGKKECSPVEFLQPTIKLNRICYAYFSYCLHVYV